MHETGIALAILRAARNEADARGGGRLLRVRVAIGDLAAVDPELLRFAWQAAIADGDCDAHLDVEWCQARRFCSMCDADKKSADGTWLPICPDCQGVLTVEGGDELDLLQVEFETGAAAGDGSAVLPPAATENANRSQPRDSGDDGVR